jgi:chemotaxis protein CheX
MTETNEVPLLSQADIVAAIESATNEVFSTMLGVEITSSEVLGQQTVTASSAGGVISVIGLAGNWAGTGGLSCTARFACKLSSQFLMTELPSVDEEVLDAVAEITNMIIGNVKTKLEQKVGEMGLSTPTVIFGHNFQARSARVQDWTVVRFTCGEDQICVQVCVAPNRDGAAKGLRPGFQFPHVIQV